MRLQAYDKAFPVFYISHDLEMRIRDTEDYKPCFESDGETEVGGYVSIEGLRKIKDGGEFKIEIGGILSMTEKIQDDYFWCFYI